jgi:hypothetical protein
MGTPLPFIEPSLTMSSKDRNLDTRSPRPSGWRNMAHCTFAARLTAAQASIASHKGDERRFGPNLGSHNVRSWAAVSLRRLFVQCDFCEAQCGRALLSVSRADRALGRARTLIQETRSLLMRSAQIQAQWQEDVCGECEMAERPSCPVCGCSEVTPISHDNLSPGTEPRVFAYHCENGHRFLAPETDAGEARKSAA